MLYKEFETKNDVYKLRLNTRNLVTLEKQLGKNPLAIFGDDSEDRLPTITEMVNILYCSLQQYHHGITLEKAYNIFDEYLEENSMTDFIPIIIEIFKVSGLIKTEEIEQEKNA